MAAFSQDPRFNVPSVRKARNASGFTLADTLSDDQGVLYSDKVRLSPFEEAQHAHLGSDWDALERSLAGKRVIGPPGRAVGPSLGVPYQARPGDEDAARTIAANEYLSGVLDQRDMRNQAQREIAARNDDRATALSDRATATRALAIANDPNTSQFGAPLVPGTVRGQAGLVTGAPEGQPPVNRQAVAAQMAPGLIAPPAPAPPVTYGAPVKATVTVNGKPEQVFVRPGSDGQTYDMGRRRIDPAAIKQDIPNDKAATTPTVAPLDANGQPVTGDALLQTMPSPKQKLVTAILEGRQSIPSGAALKDPYWKDVLESANLVDPNFDTVNFNARANTRKDFTSGKAAGQINAINTVIGHLSDLAETGDNLGNTGLNWVNSIWNKLTPGGSSRGVNLNNFETLKEGVATELMRTWRQVGAGSEKEIEDWKAQLTAAKSPEEFRGAFKTIGGMLESKLGALDSQYKQGMGTDRVTAISEASRKRLDNLQGAKEGAAPPDPLKLPEGARVPIPGGGVAQMRGGKLIRVQ